MKHTASLFAALVVASAGVPPSPMLPRRQVTDSLRLDNGLSWGDWGPIEYMGNSAWDVYETTTMSFKGPCPAVAPALLALLWLSAVPASASAAADSAPNIVFILADDLGWNDVSWHNDQVVSPNMQQLVDTGVQLEQSYVQPLCTPSRSAFLTGLYPFRLGRQGRPLGSHTPTGLAVHHTLLPERLSRLGYSTHMIGSELRSKSDLVFGQFHGE
nr:arylsulfatase B-like [Penaeus vannamei]